MISFKYIDGNSNWYYNGICKVIELSNISLIVMIIYTLRNQRYLSHGIACDCIQNYTKHNLNCLNLLIWKTNFPDFYIKNT